MRGVRFALSFGLLLVVFPQYARAWEIIPYGGTNPNGYVPFELEERVEIVLPGAYRIYVVDSGQPADLRGLTVAPNVGAVTIYLETPTGGPGVRDLGATSFGANSQLMFVNCRVARDAATLGEVRASTVTGRLEVSGGVHGPLLLDGHSGLLDLQYAEDITIGDEVEAAGVGRPWPSPNGVGGDVGLGPYRREVGARGRADNGD